MEKQVLATASYYNQKYFINPTFNDIPASIRNELRVICIGFAEKLHGIFTIGFYEDGEVYLETSAEEADYQFDEIGGHLEIKELQKEKKELFRTLRLWYMIYRTSQGEIIKELLLLKTQGVNKEQMLDVVKERFGEEYQVFVESIFES
jgi:(p)ppGpp synthase/HD superfamily hydrolase